MQCSGWLSKAVVVVAVGCWFLYFVVDVGVGVAIDVAIVAAANCSYVAAVAAFDFL